MPIYEYVCEKCGQNSEAIQKLNDPPLEECAKCGGHLRKKVSAPAFQFKGTGWYVTDYGRKDSGKSGGSSEGKSGGSSESSSGGGDDSSAKKIETKKPEPANKSSD